METIKKIRTSFPQKRILQLCAVLLLLLISVSAMPQTGGQAAWSFVALGDSRSDPEEFAKLLKLVVADPAKPELIFHTGDVVPKAMGKKGWEDYRNNIALLGNRIPVYVAVGNHETYLGPRLKNYIRYTQPPEGKTYFSIKHKNAGFIVLNSYEHFKNGKIAGKQREWMNATLKEMKAESRVIFAFIHRPLMTRDTYVHKKPLKNADEVKSAFKDAGVKVVFMGHEHRYDAFEENGIHYILTAGAGAPLYGHDENAFNHYCRVTVSPEQITITVIDDQGKEKKVVQIAAK